MDDDALQVLLNTASVFNRLGIAYALGGSWASSLFGKMRITHDADLTVEPFVDFMDEFFHSIGEDYYLSRDAVKEAIRQRTSFKLIHLPTGFKVDVFVRKDRPFDQSLLGRRIECQISESPPCNVRLVSAEDVVLLKLEWYRFGGETSERQWNDVLGVLQVQAGSLKEDYLDHWAEELGVADLLAQARDQSKDV